MLSGNNTNSVFPFFLEENPLYYDSNASPQLQLFGNIPAACNTDQMNSKVNDNNDVSATNSPIKKISQSVDLTRQNNLQISLNNLFHDEADRSRSTPNVNTVSTGLRLYYDDEERHSSATRASGSMSPYPLAMSIFDNFDQEIKRQNEEFNCYLRIQEEQFKKGVWEMKQRHLASLMSRIDRELSRKLHEKDLEIESMTRKNRELAEQALQAASEVRAWQHRSQYNESVVHALRCSLQQTMAQGAAAAAAKHGREGCGDSEVDDAASSFCPNSDRGGQRQMLKMACRGCKRREPLMLLLPCRHLCLCMNCDAMVDLCPVCYTRKTASVEVYMS